MEKFIRLLCEAGETAEKQKGLSVNLTSVFTFIGMAFCIIVAIVALVWLTCFFVRLLIKTFKTQVQNSYDVFVENSSAKTASKKERNALKRKARDARKMEILKMKEESKDRIHQMQVEKLGIKLNENENKAKDKYGVSGSEKPAKEKVQKESKQAVDSKQKAEEKQPANEAEESQED